MRQDDHSTNDAVAHKTTRWTIGLSILLLAVLTATLPRLSQAARLVCPDATDDVHHRDVMATSAPEIKVRAESQNDSARWAKVLKPLTQKAIRLAQAQRAISVEDGIEHSCMSNQQFVGQLVAVPNKPSGCDHRVVTRPADNGQIYVQVVAVCKYEWSCCVPEEKHSSAPGPVSYSLEGSLAPNASSGTAPGGPASSKKK